MIKKGFKLRKALSMIELIFVIVVLGIVASIASDMIANIYKNYVLQRAEHRANIKTELTVQEIANRLSNAIPGTIYRIKDDNTTEAIDSSIDGNYTGLEWVGSDVDSFNRYSSGKVGWSGFCDLNESNSTFIHSNGSNFNLADTVIKNLSDNNKELNGSRIFFPYDTNDYNISDFDENNLTLSNPADPIYEHYKLAWTSYVLNVESGDLYLYYQQEPKVGITNWDTNYRVLLLKNVTTFKFYAKGNVIRFKICKSEAVDVDYNITSCKEKVVFP